MGIYIALLFFCYCILLTGLIIGWARVTQLKPAPFEIIEHKLSVLVAARNEEANISKLLHALVQQNYTPFEIIVVDDHSDDETLSEVQQFKDRVSVVSNTGHGKKQALSTGMAVAGGSVIVTIDADCTVDSNWLTQINNVFQDDVVKLAFGAVRISDDKRLFSAMQQLEFSSLIGTGAATIGLGFPTMCNGANLAFRKQTFYEVGGHDDHIQIPSGDDEFLLRKVAAAYPDGIRFLNLPDSVVTTKAGKTLKDFLNQRIRWAGKWNYHQKIGSKLLAVFILGIQLSTIVGFVLIVAGFTNVFLVSVWFLKILLELFFLTRVSRFLGNNWKWLSFIFLQFIYPVYVVYIGLISNFKSFEWKGRKLKSIHSKSVYH